jgi:hypothetical protein
VLSKWIFSPRTKCSCTGAWRGSSHQQPSVHGKVRTRSLRKRVWRTRRHAKEVRSGGPDFHISYRSVSVGSSSASEVSCTHSQPVNRIFFMFYPETSYVCMLAHRNCGRAVRASLPPAQGASFKDTFCSNFKAFVRTSEVVGGGGGGGGGDLSSEDRMRHRAIASPAPLSPTQDI